MFETNVSWAEFLKKRANFETSAARFRVQMIIDLQNYLYNCFKKTKIIQIKYYDAKPIFISFNRKNKILLNSKKIKITKWFKSFNDKYYDSFEIELFIEKQVYRFRLFQTFKSIYNVFHVLLLKFHRKNFEQKFSSVMIKEEKQWKMKK